MKKNVLIFSTTYLPMAGGAEIAVKEITDRSPDFNFDLITARIKDELKGFEKIGNVNVYRIGFGIKLDKFLLPFLGLLKAFQLNFEKDYSFIWALMASQGGITAAFFRLFYSKKKMLLNIQEGDPESHLERYVLGSKLLYKIFVRPWHRLVFKKADYITTISRDLEKRAKENKADCPIEIIPNGVDIDRFQVELSDSEIKSYRKKTGFSENDTVLITTSRLVKKNAVGDVIKSLNYLPKQVKFLILGEGSLEGELKALAEKEGLEERVVFLGNVDHREIPKYLKVSDIFIRPSFSEGLGNSFLEAMLAGLPVIATPVGGIIDFLKNEETGLFCEVEDPEDISQKVSRLINEQELRQKLVKQSQAMVKEKYNWEKIAKDMDQIFAELLGEKAR